MRPTHARPVRPSSSFSLGAIAFSVLAGCTAADSAGSPDGLLPSEPAAPERAIVAEIIGHISPSRGTITFEPRVLAAPGLEQQTIDSLNLVQNEIPNDGTPNTVELETNSVGYDTECPAPYHTSTFCGNVTLRSFYARSLPNTFVQITSIMPDTDHNALNSDPSELGLDDTFGLWKYTAPAASTEGVLGTAPHHEATKDWVFSNPDNADTSIIMRVVSSLRYSNHTFDYSSAAFIDACSGGVVTTAASAQQTLPFRFILYQSSQVLVRYNNKGVITFGNVSGTASGANVGLPSSSAPRPGVFVFWDNLKYGAGGKMCYKVVGSAPNRQAVITWNNMTFADGPDLNTANLQFGAILDEGTNNVHVVYNNMTGMTSRVTGDSATIGVQNESGTTATAELNLGNYGTGSAYAFVPNP